MKATKKQELARKRNWALYQLKSTRSNLVHSMKMLGMDVTKLQTVLRDEELRIKFFYIEAIRRLDIDQGK